MNRYDSYINAPMSNFIYNKSNIINLKKYNEHFNHNLNRSDNNKTKLKPENDPILSILNKHKHSVKKDLP